MCEEPAGPVVWIWLLVLINVVFCFVFSPGDVGNPQVRLMSHTCDLSTPLLFKECSQACRCRDVAKREVNCCV